tara:strand:- start:193 stop:570 length:378 start_codon:yes stop_codon:yes gene_type:complete
MNRAEFKKILKPLIKETVKEVILEEGVLSGIVTEVVRGMNSNVVTETKKRSSQDDLKEKYEKDRQERIRRLNESAKINESNVFKDTQQIREHAPGSPLSGTDPSDKGVDISGILDVVNDKWKRMI